VVTKIIALFFIALPFIPVAYFYESGRIKGAGTAFGPYQWFLGIVITLFVAYAMSLAPINNLVTKLCSKFSLIIERKLLLPCMICLAVILNVCSYFCFEHKPHLIDTIVQFFQAKTFLAGQLKASALKYPEFFTTHNMISDSTGWYSQYPPGHQILLSIGLFLKVPWLVNIILSLITFYFTYKVSLKKYGQRHANLSALLMLVCPFFFFMGSEYMNHVSTLCCISLFLYFYFCWRENTRYSSLFLAAIFMGYGLLIRPLTILAISIPFIFDALFFAKKNKLLKQVFFVLPVGLVYIILNGFYNLKMYGDFNLPGYIKLWGSSHNLGFHTNPWGESHTFFIGLRNEITDLSLLNDYLFEWPLPVMMIIGLYLFLSKQIERHEKLFLSSLLSLPLAYLFYWHRDAFLGPRFLYEIIIFLVFFTSSSLIYFAKKMGQMEIGYKGFFKLVKGRTFYFCLCLVALCYSLFISIPSTFAIYKSGMESIKLDLTKRAKQEGIKKGIIFTKVSFGARLYSLLSTNGLSASLTQIAYSNVGHCQLYDLVQEKINGGADNAQFNQKVNALIKQKQILIKIQGHKDKTVKVVQNSKISNQCRQELVYDTKTPFSVYSGQMYLNDPNFKSDYILAMDMRGRNGLLVDQYKDYPAYIYYPDQFVQIK